MTEQIRIDKWLFHARFFKTRSLAARQVAAGQIRVNGERVTKPAHPVGPEDELSFAQGRHVRIVRIVACGTRRGPATEAQTLYEDHSPPVPPSQTPHSRIGERPTKKDRRTMDQLRRGKT